MLTSSERHFIQSWKEQREGPRWKYYLQYIVAWTTVSFLSLFFVTKVIMSDRSMGGRSGFYILFIVSIVLATLVTHIVYTQNEKRFKKISEKNKVS